MKIIYLSLLLSLFITSDEYKGFWQTDKENTVIKIYEENNAYYGEIVSSDDPKVKTGTKILRDFTYTDGVWKGKLYAIKMDKLVDAEMLLNNKALEVTAHLGFMNKTIKWKKVTN